MTNFTNKSMNEIYRRCKYLFHKSFSPPPTSEHRRQRSDLHHLLPPVQGDAAGQTAEQGRGDPHPALDLHQILPGEILGHITSVYLQYAKLQVIVLCNASRLSSTKELTSLYL